MKTPVLKFLLIKLQLQTPTQVFSHEYFENLKNTYFENLFCLSKFDKHLWTAASNYGNLDNFL